MSLSAYLAIHFTYNHNKCVMKTCWKRQRFADKGNKSWPELREIVFKVVGLTTPTNDRNPLIEHFSVRSSICWANKIRICTKVGILFLPIVHFQFCHYGKLKHKQSQILFYFVFGFSDMSKSPLNGDRIRKDWKEKLWRTNTFVMFPNGRPILF